MISKRKDRRIIMATCILLFLSLILISSPEHGMVNNANADNAALVYAPNYHIDGVDDEGEEGNTTAVCQYIQYLFTYYEDDYGWEGCWTDYDAAEWRYLNNALN